MGFSAESREQIKQKIMTEIEENVISHAVGSDRFKKLIEKVRILSPELANNIDEEFTNCITDAVHDIVNLHAEVKISVA